MRCPLKREKLVIFKTRRLELSTRRFKGRKTVGIARDTFREGLVITMENTLLSAAFPVQQPDLLF